MITIDQLLESVDLYFEPRWITKDECGAVAFWGKKPTVDKKSHSWYCFASENQVYPSLKLAEFADKPWSECIYEVPQKTTGKIERFTPDDFATVVSVKNCLCSALDDRAFDKLNSLVDAVNELKGAKNETKI